MAVRLQYGFNEASGAYQDLNGGSPGSLTATGSRVAGHGTGSAIQSSTSAPGGDTRGSPILACSTWTAITVMGWIKPNGNTGDTLVGNIVLNTNILFGFKFLAVSQLAAWIVTDATSSQVQLANHGIANGTWMHIAFTWSASDAIHRMFVNGVEVATISAPGTILKGDLTVLAIAGGDPSWTSGPSNIPMDDVRIFDTAESAASIAIWMNTPADSTLVTGDAAPAATVAVSVTGSVSKANAAGVTLVESTDPLDGWGATTNPKVSPTVDVEAGDILVAFGIGKDSGSNVFPGLPTNSGTPLTWTRKVNQAGGGSSSVSIYTATAVSTETITVTLTLITSTGPWSFRLLQWRGAIGVGASLGNAQAPAAVQPAITLGTTGRRSVIISGHSDANAIDASARVWNTVNASAMAEASYYQAASVYAVMIGYSTDAGNGGSLALGLTGTGAGTHNWANGAVEILAPVAPSPPRTRSFAIPRAARW